MSGRSSEQHNRKAGKGSQAGAKAAWLGFVDIPLTDKDKEVLSQGHFEGEDLLAFVEDMTDEGYKITLSQDAAHSCYVASATGLADNNPNRGYTLTARGPDVIGCVACLAYKHITLANGGVWANSANGSGTSNWG